MGKKKSTFRAKIKHYPSIVRDGVTHVYPFLGAKVSRIVERDRLYFAANPNIGAYIRAYVPGELDGIRIPDGMNLSDIAYILVKRLPGGLQQARMPLTREQAQELREKKDQSS
jgi:hypothetical protein